MELCALYDLVSADFSAKQPVKLEPVFDHDKAWFILPAKGESNFDVTWLFSQRLFRRKYEPFFFHWNKQKVHELVLSYKGQGGSSSNLTCKAGSSLLRMRMRYQF